MHYGPSGTKLSRSEAAQIRQVIAKAIGMSDEELAVKLSEYFQANQPAISDQNAKAFIAAFGVGRCAN
jgi:hypothetical protein